MRELSVGCFKLPSLGVICYAATNNEYRAEGGERGKTGDGGSGHILQGPGNPPERFLHFILSEKGAI